MVAPAGTVNLMEALERSLAQGNEARPARKPSKLVAPRTAARAAAATKRKSSG